MCYDEAIHSDVWVLQQVSTMPFLVTENGHELAMGAVPVATGSLSICTLAIHVRGAIVSSSGCRRK